MNAAVHPVVDFERVEEVATRLGAAISSARVFGRAHQRTLQARRAFATGLMQLFEQGNTPEAEFTLAIEGGMLSFEGIPLPRPAVYAKLLDRLTNSDYRGISFQPGVGDPSVEALISWVLDGASRLPPEGIPRIRFLHLESRRHTGIPEDPLQRLLAIFPEFGGPARVYLTGTRTLEAAYDDLQSGRAINIAEVSGLAHLAAEEAYRSGVRLVAPTQVLSTDASTLRHSVNVFLIATALLQPLTSSAEELASIAEAALLHDIGKSRLPHAILNKEGKLSEKEMELVRLHPEWGAEILLETGFPNPLAVEVAYCHHMRDNGHGYPNPQTGLRPGPISNVIQVADMFEALTSRRSYKEAMSAAEAVRILRETPGMESKMPALWMLVGRLTSSPPGSEVLLDSGERGIVLSPNPDHPDRPVVRITMGARGVPLREQVVVDLASPGEARFVVKVVLKPELLRRS